VTDGQALPRLLALISHLAYRTCPRGQGGGFEGHRAVYLEHRLIGDRLVCIDAELAARYDRDRATQP
jgi:hypothetical protein